MKFYIKLQKWANPSIASEISALCPRTRDLEGAKAKGLVLKQENSPLVKQKGARVHN